MSTETGAWMPMYWGDYFGDTMHLTTEEHGAYILLIGTYWRRGRSLPDDDRWLASVTKMHTNRWRVLRPKLADLFDIEPGVGWTHKRLEKEIVKSSARLSSARASGRAGGLAKSKLTTTTVTKKKKRDVKNVSPKSDFDQWWLLVPKKTGKGAAERKFKIARKKADLQTIRTATIRWAKESAFKEPQYIVGPARWLHEERWLDEPERKPHGNQHRGNGAGKRSAHAALLAAGAKAAGIPAGGVQIQTEPVSKGTVVDGSGTEGGEGNAPSIPRIP